MLNRASTPARTLSQSVLPVTSLRSVPGAGVGHASLGLFFVPCTRKVQVRSTPARLCLRAHACAFQAPTHAKQFACSPGTFASLRFALCPGRDLNPHACALNFKSSVYTNSTTRAYDSYEGAVCVCGQNGETVLTSPFPYAFPYVFVEAQAGIEPANSGFADRRVSHFTTGPSGYRISLIE